MDRDLGIGAAGLKRTQTQQMVRFSSRFRSTTSGSKSLGASKALKEALLAWIEIHREGQEYDLLVLECDHDADPALDKAIANSQLVVSPSAYLQCSEAAYMGLIRSRSSFMGMPTTVRCIECKSRKGPSDRRHRTPAEAFRHSRRVRSSVLYGLGRVL